MRWRFAAITLLFCIGSNAGFGDTNLPDSISRLDSSAPRANASSGQQEPVGQAFTDDPVVREYLVDLLRLSGEGFRTTERGAFIVAGPEGDMQCVLWPSSNGFQSEAFNGAIPEGTVAVAHTHPRGMPRPSRTDRAESVRLQLPFVIVSAVDLYLVDPDEESPKAIVKNQAWARDVRRDGGSRCVELRNRN